MSQTKVQLVEGLNINTAAPATALQIDSSGNINLDSNTLYVDATNNRVGIGNNAPGALLDLGTATTTQGYIKLRSTGSGAREANLYSPVGGGLTIDTNSYAYPVIIQADNIQLGTGTSGLERARIDSSGRLLVGTATSIGTSGGFTPGVQVAGNSTLAAISAGRYANSASPPHVVLQKSRNATIGSHTIVNSGDEVGAVSFEGSDGSAFIGAALISAYVDGTPGTNDMPGRLVFSTTADGASSPTERMRINGAGDFICPSIYNGAVANAANVYVASNGQLYRSTSSIKYKTDVETLENSYADALLGCRPVWYRSLNSGDNPEHGYYGFIAEEVAEIDPRLVHWKTTEITYDEKGSVVETPCDPKPEGVQYDRFVPHLLNLIKRQGEAIAELQAEVAALKGA